MSPDNPWRGLHCRFVLQLYGVGKRFWRWNRQDKPLAHAKSLVCMHYSSNMSC